MADPKPSPKMVQVNGLGVVEFPHDPIPSVQNARNAGRGETRPIYADVYWRFTDQDCSYLDRVVTAAIW
jgi:hypothetical protein